LDEAKRQKLVEGEVGEPQSAETPNWAVVKSSDLGTNCWLPKRFVKGSRCDRLMQCNYPEKKTCKAVQAEIDFLGKNILDIQEEAVSRQEKAAQVIRELMELQGQK